jgi:hypothetical protein
MRAAVPGPGRAAPESAQEVPRPESVRPDRDPLADRRVEPADPTELDQQRSMVMQLQGTHRFLSRAARHIQQARRRLESVVDSVKVQITLNFSELDDILAT